MFYKNKEEVDQGKRTVAWARIWIYPECTEQERGMRCLDTFQFYSFAHVCSAFIASLQCARDCARCWGYSDKQNIGGNNTFQINK